MQLFHLLNKDLIFCNEEVSDIESLYEKIAIAINAKYGLDKSAVKDAFHKRGDLGYTIFPDGSVIPHGRLDGLDDIIIAIVRTNKKLDISGDKADLFYLILTSNAGSNRYLKALASFAKISMMYADKIRNCNTPDQIIQFISKQDFELDKIVKVKEIITGSVYSVRLDDPISEVADKMKKYNIIFMPVVDENNKYLGKIDILDIIKIAYPEYIRMMADISFLSNMRAFEDYLEAEKTKTVRDLYSKAEDKIINEEDFVIELGYLFAKKNWHHVTVVNDENTVVGVLSTRSFLNNILRA